MMFAFLIETADLIMIGHMGNVAYISGVGLAYSFINIFIFGLYIGLIGGLETLVSQAIGTNPKKANEILNKALMINTLLFIPIAGVLLCSNSILVSIGIDPESSKYCFQFIVFQIPGLYC